MQASGQDGLEPAARELWEARMNASPIENTERWRALTLDQGEAIFAELGAALEASGSPHVGAKIGEPDAETAARMGLDGPVSARIYANSLLEGGGTLELSEMISPMFELEIGVRVSPDGERPVPCIEIVDSRFNWGAGGELASGDLMGGQLIADFAGSGRFVFGQPSGNEMPSTVRAQARRDGEEVVAGERPLAEALGVLTRLRPYLPESPESGEQLVATGTLTPPLSLSAGEWEFDFGELGSLRLTVAP
jgi:2-keto-4-pentenoate hydratase